MNNEKKTYVPQLFDRVHNDTYGYGTVIGVKNPDDFDPTAHNAIVLFDSAHDDLHSGGVYSGVCDSWIDVSPSVRSNRCYWCDVQELPIYLDYSAGGRGGDVVCLIPFDTLTYKGHPIRVACTLPHAPTFNGSIVTRTQNEDFLILCDAGGYCWAKANNISFLAEILGTVSDVWDNGEVEDDDDEGVGEDLTNPSYYNVEGASQPIEDMEALMTPEQFEGFLWGNIIKYSKRFGRKGDKILTLGKIIWYAERLKTHLEKESDANGHD
jgi:hypothetical protein